MKGLLVLLFITSAVILEARTHVETGGADPGRRDDIGTAMTNETMSTMNKESAAAVPINRKPRNDKKHKKEDDDDHGEDDDDDDDDHDGDDDDDDNDDGDNDDDNDDDDHGGRKKRETPSSDHQHMRPEGSNGRPGKVGDTVH